MHFQFHYCSSRVLSFRFGEIHDPTQMANNAVPYFEKSPTLQVGFPSRQAKYRVFSKLDLSV
jgi:hypothetical protein